MCFMDIQIPQIDGHTATRRIRDYEDQAAAIPVPIIALSANTSPMDKQKSLEAGCNGHITKPLQKDKLWKTIVFYVDSLPFTKH